MNSKRNSTNSRKRLSSKTDDECALDESKILEERLRDLLRGNNRELRRPRNVFNNIQEDVPKLRRSVVFRALQSVISSTPMHTRNNKADFFPTEISLNISPIDKNSEELEENQIENINHYEEQIDSPVKDVNLPPMPSLPIVISDTTDEEDREVQKCLEEKTSKVYNTRSQSKINGTVQDKSNSKTKSKDYHENMRLLAPNKSSDKENTHENIMKSKGEVIEKLVTILDEKAESSEKSKTNMNNNRSKDVLSNRKRIDVSSSVNGQKKTKSLPEAEVQKPVNFAKPNRSKNFESPSKNHTKGELSESEAKNQHLQEEPHQSLSCVRNTRSHGSVNSTHIEFDIISKTLQNENCDNQREPIQLDTTKKVNNEILMSTNKSIKDIVIPLQTSAPETSLNVRNKTFNAITPNSKPRHTNLPSQKSLKESNKTPDKEQSLQKVSVGKNVSHSHDSVVNEKEFSRRLPPRKLSFAEKSNQMLDKIDTDLKQSDIQEPKKVAVKPSNIPVLRSRSKSKEKRVETEAIPSTRNRSRSKNEQPMAVSSSVLNKSEEKANLNVAETNHSESSVKKDDEGLNIQIQIQIHSPPKRPPRRRKTKNRKNKAVISETESNLSPTRQHPFVGFDETTDGTKNVNVFMDENIENNKFNNVSEQQKHIHRGKALLEKSFKQIEENLQKSRTLGISVKQLLDKSNMTAFEKTVADIGTQISSPVCKSDAGAVEKSSNTSKIIKNKSFVETALSPITIINGNKSFEKVTEKTLVDTGTSPFVKVNNKTSAYNKPENLNRIISRISERTLTLNSPKTPYVAIGERVNCINRVVQTEGHSLNKRNSQGRIHRGIQTSVKKTPRHPYRNEIAKKIFNQDLVEQQTQTTSSVDKMFKTYKNRNLRNDPSDSSASEDPSMLLRDYDKDKISRNMIFQSLKEDIRPFSFSSSEDEFLNETITSNRLNKPWRLHDDACVFPRRSSLKLNLFRSSYQIEMEKISQAKPPTKYSSDSDDETDIEPPRNKNKLAVSPYLRKYSGAKQRDKFSSPESVMPKSSDEDTAAPNSVMSNLVVENHEQVGENNGKEQDNNNFADVDDEYVVLPIVNEVDKADLAALIAEESCANQAVQSPVKIHDTSNISEDNRSNLIVVLNNVTINGKTNKSVESRTLLNSSAHSVKRSNRDRSNLQEQDDEILAVPLPQNEESPNKVETFAEEREAGEENQIKNISGKADNEVDATQSDVRKKNESVMDVEKVNDETKSAPNKISSPRKRTSQKALEELLASEAESAQNEINRTNVSQNVLQEAIGEVHTAQKNVRSSHKKTKPQRNNHSGISETAVRISARISRSRKLLQDVNDELHITQNQVLGSSNEADSHREMIDVNSQMQSILNDRRRISSKVDDTVSNEEPEEAIFKIPKPRKPRKKNTSGREDVVSSTTSEGSFESGIRRSGRERKPVTGRLRFMGVIETYSEKELHWYNSGITGITRKEERATGSTKPRTKKRSTEKTPKNSKLNKKAKKVSEQIEDKSNPTNTPQHHLNNLSSTSNNINNILESSPIIPTVTENCENQVISSAHVDMANNNCPMDDNESNVNKNSISNISGINHLPSNSSTETADDFIVPQETMDNYNSAVKCLDKDSGRSTMLRSTTFDDSHLRDAKVLTGRIGKKHKRKEDFSTKISRVLSRSINQSKELEILNINDMTDSMIMRDEDKRVRKSTLVMSNIEDGEFINVIENNETVRCKYVEQQQTFKMGLDGLMISNLLSSREDRGTMGYLKVPPATQKPLRISTKHDLFYFVIEGEGFIQVQNKTSRIVKLSDFIVPWGIEYSITNLSKEVALILGFVKVQHKAI